MATDISELEEAAKQLREGLKDVDENIKKLTGRDPSEPRPTGSARRVQLKRTSFPRETGGIDAKRRLSDGGPARRWGGRSIPDLRATINHATKLDSSGEEDTNKIKSAVRSSVVTTATVEDINSTPIPKKQTPKVDSQMKSRNKRMFGLLMGTLQQFKEETKSLAPKEKKRIEIEKKLDEKAAQEKQEVADQKRELFQSRRQKQQELKELEMKLNTTELKNNMTSHYQLLKNHIRLKSTPSVFYLPATHTDATLKLLDESQKSMDKLLSSRFEQIEQVSKSPIHIASVVSVQTNDSTPQTKEKNETNVKTRLGDRLKSIADNYDTNDNDNSETVASVDESNPTDNMMDDKVAVKIEKTEDTTNQENLESIPAIIAATYLNDDDEDTAATAVTTTANNTSMTDRRVIVKTEDDQIMVKQEEGEI